MNFFRTVPKRRRARDTGFGGAVGRAMLVGITEGLWISPWADAVEESGGRTPRSITLESADPAPASAKRLARKFASLLVKLNKATLTQIHARASEADGGLVDPRELGYYLAMQAQGHGVGWTDNHAAFSVILPSAEVHAHGSRGRWQLDGYVTERLARPMRDRSRVRRTARRR